MTSPEQGDQTLTGKQRAHSHLWVDGEFLQNGCALPHPGIASALPLTGYGAVVHPDDGHAYDGCNGPACRRIRPQTPEGRWQRSGWHTLRCFTWWAGEPEYANCICDEPTSPAETPADTAPPPGQSPTSLDRASQPAASRSRSVDEGSPA